MPDTWGLRVFVCNAAGRQKEGVSGVEEVVQDVAGPLCFQVGWLACEVPKLSRMACMRSASAR
jgi:hypothetical protein